MDDNLAVSSQLFKQAINAALDQKWEDAIKLNRRIIKLDPCNIDALNRQAKAYMELGKLNLAKKFYSEALKFDPYNPIASKNLKIIKSFRSNGQTSLPHKITEPCDGEPGNGRTRLSPSLFLQEPGKTKIVNLLKVAEPQKLSHVYCGMKVLAEVKNRKIIVTDTEREYLGVLPDDVSHCLIRLLKGGNKYELFVKSIKVNGLSVLIREMFRSKRFKNQPSFLDFSSSNISSDMITSFDNSDEEETSEETEEPEV